MIDATAYIAQGAIVLGDVNLGKDASVWYNTVIRGDTAPSRSGMQTNIQDLSMLHADEGLPCRVGHRVTVGHRVILHGCTVEDDCLIGMGAILLNRVRVGRGSVIGAGALLLEGTEIPPGSLVVGFPGKVVRPVDGETQQVASSRPGGITSLLHTATGAGSFQFGRASCNPCRLGLRKFDRRRDCAVFPRRSLPRSRVGSAEPSEEICNSKPRRRRRLSVDNAGQANRFHRASARHRLRHSAWLAEGTRWRGSVIPRLHSP